MAVVIRRFEVYDQPIGSETQKSRPCLVISPDEMNSAIRTVIIPPMTPRGRAYPTRVHCRFQRKNGQIVLDQIRTVDQGRLTRKLGKLDPETLATVLEVLREMFAA